MSDYKEKYEKLKIKFDTLQNEYDNSWQMLDNINMNMDIHDVIDQVITSIRNLTSKIKRCNLGLIEDDDYMVIHDLSKNLSKSIKEDTLSFYKNMIFNRKFKYKESPVYMCIAARNNEEIYIEDIREKKELSTAEKVYFKNVDYTGLYILPLTIKEKILGSIVFTGNEGALKLTEYEKSLIRKKVSIIAWALESNNLFNNLKKQRDQLERKNKTIKEDLLLAKRIQNNLIPKKAPDIENVEFATKYIPMFEVGGDYFDFHIDDLNNNTFSVIITDASGHGVSAAFITSMLKMSFNNVFVRQNLNTPDFVLKQLNNDLLDKTAGNFVTAFYGYFNLNKMSLCLACAGHNPLYKISRKTGDFEEIHPRGRILGFLDNISFEVKEMSLQKGDRFFFYTDGLTEAINEKKEEFEPFLISLIKEFHYLDANTFCDTIIRNLKDFALIDKKEFFDDDIAIVVVDIN